MSGVRIELRLTPPARKDEAADDKEIVLREGKMRAASSGD
jgi:hypothetical protein